MPASCAALTIFVPPLLTIDTPTHRTDTRPHLSPVSADPQAQEVFKAISSVDQDNYPETMGATFVVNAPWIFSMVWKIVRVFLDEGVRVKVHICREGEETLTALRREIDEENIPSFLGGKCKCPGGCVSGVDCTNADGAAAPRPLRFGRCAALCAERVAARCLCVSRFSLVPFLRTAPSLFPPLLHFST